MKAEIEFLKISARAFKIAMIYNNGIKDDYIKILETYLLIPSIDKGVAMLIHEEIEFFAQY